MLRILREKDREQKHYQISKNLEKNSETDQCCEITRVNPKKRSQNFKTNIEKMMDIKIYAQVIPYG